MVEGATADHSPHIDLSSFMLDAFSLQFCMGLKGGTESILATSVAGAFVDIGGSVSYPGILQLRGTSSSVSRAVVYEPQDQWSDLDW